MADVLYGKMNPNGVFSPFEDQQAARNAKSFKMEGHHVMIRCGCGDPDSHAKLGKHCPKPEPLRVEDYRAGSRHYSKQELAVFFESIRNNHFLQFGIVIPIKELGHGG